MAQTTINDNKQEAKGLPNTGDSAEAGDSWNAAIAKLNAMFSEVYGTINTYTADHTLGLADLGSVVEMNSASANNLTVPPDSSVAFAIGTRMELVQFGAGTTTVVAGGGVTVRSLSGSLALGGQYAAASLYKRATNDWVLAGGLA